MVIQYVDFIFAKDDLLEGVRLLEQLVNRTPIERFTDIDRAILNDCVKNLDAFGLDRLEYILLTLHIVYTGWPIK